MDVFQRNIEMQKRAKKSHSHQVHTESQNNIKKSVLQQKRISH